MPSLGVAAYQYDAFQADAFQTNQAPHTVTIQTPTTGAAYVTSLTLAATATDPDGDNWYATFEYDLSDNTWVSIGNGATVASATQSTLAWSISTFAESNVVRVRVRATDTWGDFVPSGFQPGAFQDDAIQTGYAVTGAFRIGPSLTELNAMNDTATYSPENKTTTYYAERATATYAAEKV